MVSLFDCYRNLNQTLSYDGKISLSGDGLMDRLFDGCRKLNQTFSYGGKVFLT
jgi:hypothetical protein